jgi:outer membrane murein-binding lipoprotein Lpp
MSDTIPSPAQDEEAKTSPHHEIPESTGEAPQNIPAAPPYMQELFAKLNEISTDVRALNGVKEQMQLLSSSVKEMNANLDLALNAFHAHQQATDARFGEATALHNQLRADLKTLKGRVDAMERQLNELIGDGR